MSCAERGLRESCLGICDTLSKISAELAWPGHSMAVLDGIHCELDKCIESIKNASAVADQWNTWNIS